MDGRDLDAWKAAIQPNTKAFFFETPTNPTLELVDVEGVCKLARDAGALSIIDNVFATPILQKPLELGADIVVYAVGGRSGAKAFDQAQDMVRRGGLIQVIGLYEDEPLPLWSSKIQGKRLIGGYLDGSKREWGSDESLRLLSENKIRVEEMITHRFPFSEAAEAFDLLYNRLGETMVVVLTWD